MKIGKQCKKQRLNWKGWMSYPTKSQSTKRYNFEELKIVPQKFPRHRLELVAGTHDPRAQEFLNKFAPVKVFNLSITSPEVIESTHERMNNLFEENGNSWHRKIY